MGGEERVVEQDGRISRKKVLDRHRPVRSRSKGLNDDALADDACWKLWPRLLDRGIEADARRSKGRDRVAVQQDGSAIVGDHAHGGQALSPH
ncbi:hypothetical protein GFL84_23205 [Rhizobium leguminosarum bv. viciae]|nr:hypothetical protein [Rhizobium leguminosarum bv. viciae]TBZ77024.1 hypothetical protein E0H43_06910 [Rhizobium leguminosarum bv. viciae]